MPMPTGESPYDCGRDNGILESIKVVERLRDTGTPATYEAVLDALTRLYDQPTRYAPDEHDSADRRMLEMEDAVADGVTP